jgi:glucose-6-phosphate isomerase
LPGLPLAMIGGVSGEPFGLVELGPAGGAVEAALAEIEATDTLRRLWADDPALWTGRLGWLRLPSRLLESDTLADLERFADGVRRDGLRWVLVCGMGGSSLAPEVFRRTFGGAADYPTLLVLDSTDPAAVTRVDQLIDPGSTLFVISSKSGATIEVESFLAYYWQRARQRAEQFCAITDPGTGLERLARERRFRRVFLNPTDVEGRYSALSLIGLVPAALAGMDVRALLAAAAGEQRRAEVTDPRANPGARLGALLGGLARAGRDKLTVLASPRIAGFGPWIEQLVAESTGKDGTGIVPVVGEPVGPVEAYADDRWFVALRLEGDTNDALDRHTAALAGRRPLVVVDVPAAYGLGAEAYRWELATVIAARLLGVDPFDAPNVQEGKDNTERVLRAVGPEGVVPPPPAELHLRARDIVPLRRFLRGARAGDYVAVQAYLTPSGDMERSLASLRGCVAQTQRVATTLGFGPRFLHSTGQLHKGGPPRGVFLQLTYEPVEDLPIPGRPYSFRTLFRAQALGDLHALHARGRRIVRLDLGDRDLERTLAALPVEATAGAA